MIEGARAVRRVRAADVLADGLRPAHVDLPAATLPQQELDQPLGILQIGFGARVAVRENSRLKARQRATYALQAEHQRHPNA